MNFNKGIQDKIDNLPFIEVGKAKDLTHQTFGRLYVLGRAPKPENSKETRAFWWCICLNDNNIVRVIGKSLLNGDTKSCGCIQKEKASINATKRNISNNKPGRGNRKDLTNQSFGFLTALEATEKRAEDGSIIWKCRCTREGNVIYASSHLLLNGSIKSCGCVNSFGEAKIENILQQNNIKYKKQYSFPDLLSDKKAPLKFDFGILNQDGSLKYLIEYDGSQHFDFKGTGWNTEEHLKYTQEHDQRKNEYCKNNNIKLVRIKYTKFNTLSLEDLQYDN